MCFPPCFFKKISAFKATGYCTFLVLLAKLQHTPEAELGEAENLLFGIRIFMFRPQLLNVGVSWGYLREANALHDVSTCPCATSRDGLSVPQPKIQKSTTEVPEPLQVPEHRSRYRAGRDDCGEETQLVSHRRAGPWRWISLKLAKMPSGEKMSAFYREQTPSLGKPELLVPPSNAPRVKKLSLTKFIGPSPSGSSAVSAPTWPGWRSPYKGRRGFTTSLRITSGWCHLLRLCVPRTMQRMARSD